MEVSTLFGSSSNLRYKWFYSLNESLQYLSQCCVVGAFVKRVIAKSDCVEFLSLKKVMNQFMSSLLDMPLGAPVSVDIKFVSDKEAFEKAVTDNFGHFKLRDESVLKSQQQQLQQVRLIRLAERQASRANLAVSY